MLEVLERLLYVWRKHDSNDDAFWHIARATNRIRIVRASGGGERAVQQFIRHHRRQYKPLQRFRSVRSLQLGGPRRSHVLPATHTNINTNSLLSTAPVHTQYQRRPEFQTLKNGSILWLAVFHTASKLTPNAASASVTLHVSRCPSVNDKVILSIERLLTMSIHSGRV